MVLGGVFGTAGKAGSGGDVGEAFGGVLGATITSSLTSGRRNTSFARSNEFGSPTGAAVERKASLGGCANLTCLHIAIGSIL